MNEKKIAVPDSPAGAPETVAATQQAKPQTVGQEAREYWRALGPGLTTGAADDDPSGIATYSQVGASYGFQLSWLALLTLPLMATVQEMCARIGLVTGRGLAGNIRLHYPRKVLLSVAGLLFLANAFNIGADLGAMAEAARLIWPGMNFYLLLVGFAVASVCMQVFFAYASYAKYLKYLAMALFVYILAALVVGLDWGELLKSTLVPSLTASRTQLLLIAAVLGTTISPYLFFWQTSQEVEEEILKGEKSLASRQQAEHGQEIKTMRFDVWSGMFVSNCVMFFIIAATGATLHGAGSSALVSASDAAAALRPVAGEFASLLFALGIIGTGLLAVPVLAGSASYALSESFHWREGLYRKWSQAKGFYGVIIAAVFVGLLLNIFHFNPLKTLVYSAAFNGLVSPVILLFVVRIAGSAKIMGGHSSGHVSNALGWLTFGIMTVTGLAFLISWVV